MNPNSTIGITCIILGGVILASGISWILHLADKHKTRYRREEDE